MAYPFFRSRLVTEILRPAHFPSRSFHLTYLSRSEISALYPSSSSTPKVSQSYKPRYNIQFALRAPGSPKQPPGFSSHAGDKCISSAAYYMSKIWVTGANGGPIRRGEITAGQGLTTDHPNSLAPRQFSYLSVPEGLGIRPNAFANFVNRCMSHVLRRAGGS